MPDFLIERCDRDDIKNLSHNPVYLSHEVVSDWDTESWIPTPIATRNLRHWDLTAAVANLETKGAGSNRRYLIKINVLIATNPRTRLEFSADRDSNVIQDFDDGSPVRRSPSAMPTASRRSQSEVIDDADSEVAAPAPVATAAVSSSLGGSPKRTPTLAVTASSGASRGLSLRPSPVKSIELGDWVHLNDLLEDDVRIKQEAPDNVQIKQEWNVKTMGKGKRLEVIDLTGSPTTDDDESTDLFIRRAKTAMAHIDRLIAQAGNTGGSASEPQLRGAARVDAEPTDLARELEDQFLLGPESIGDSAGDSDGEGGSSESQLRGTARVDAPALSEVPARAVSVIEASTASVSTDAGGLGRRPKVKEHKRKRSEQVIKPSDRVLRSSR